LIEYIYSDCSRKKSLNPVILSVYDLVQLEKICATERLTDMSFFSMSFARIEKVGVLLYKKF